MQREINLSNMRRETLAHGKQRFLGLTKLPKRSLHFRCALAAALIFSAQALLFAQ